MLDLNGLTYFMVNKELLVILYVAQWHLQNGVMRVAHVHLAQGVGNLFLAGGRMKIKIF